VVVTDTFKQKIIARGIDSEKISVFKNAANLELFVPQQKDALLEQELNLQGKFVFAYIGTHGMAHGLDFILNSIQELEQTRPEVRFLFIGDGAEKKKLIQQAKDLKLTNAVFVDSVSKQEVVRYLSLMDVALVNLKKSDTFLTVIPSKIFEAAAMKKPILLGLEGETKGIIEKYDAGICYLPEDKNSFHQAVEKIIDPITYTEKVLGTQQLIKHFDRSKIASKMLACLKSV